MKTYSLIKARVAVAGICLASSCLSAWSSGAPVIQVATSGDVRNHLHEPDQLGITEYADSDVRAYLTHKGKKERNERAAQQAREEITIEPAGKPAYRFRLEEGDQLAELHRYQDRLIVVAWHNSIGLSTVTVVDWRSGKKQDSFLAIKPSVSPDGRHIAFVRMYPMHGINSWEDQIRVYDLSKSQRDNRHLRWPDDHSDEIGVAVYPKAGKDGHAPNNVRVPHTMSLASRLVWAADSSEFAVLMERQEKYVVVRATGGSFADVARYDIPDPKAFCLHGYEASNCGGRLKPDGIALEFGPEGVTLKTSPNGGTAANTQMFRREWFKPVR